MFARLRLGLQALPVARMLAQMHAWFMTSSVPTEEPLRFRTISTDIGDLGLVASTRGLTHVLLTPSEDFPALGKEHALAHARRDSEYEGDGDEPEVHLDATEKQLRQYFKGKRTSFALILDLTQQRSGRFRTQAQLALGLVPYGTTASYGEIAELVGVPGAARAVGTACRTNPVPIVLPCHRIIRGDGRLGLYGGGEDYKRRLLEFEGVSVTD